MSNPLAILQSLNIRDFQQLGQKVRHGAIDLGRKVNSGARDAKGFVRSSLKSAGDTVQGGAKSASLDSVARSVGSALRELDSIRKAVPKEIRTVIFDWLPTGRVLDGSIYSADVLGGRKDLSPDKLREIFPLFQIFMLDLDGMETLTSGDKARMRKEIPKILTAYAVAVFQLAEDLAIVGLV